MIRPIGVRRVLLSLAAATLAATTAACGGDSGSAGTTSAASGGASVPAGSTMERLKNAQSIRIGTKFDQPLFGLKGLDGKPQGFDVEIAKIVASEMGIPADKIQWTETPSAVREEVIERGTVDLVVATYTINDKRKERVGFAGPYYTAGQDIMVRSDETTITGPESLRGSGKKVCSVTGSTPAEKIKEYADPSQITLFAGYSNCADALRQRQVDAVTTDNVILLGLVDQSSGQFKLVGKPFTQEPYGIGVKRDDTALRNFVNDALEKAARDGRYEKAWKDTAGKVQPQVPTLPTINRY